MCKLTEPNAQARHFAPGGQIHPFLQYFKASNNQLRPTDVLSLPLKLADTLNASAEG